MLFDLKQFAFSVFVLVFPALIAVASCQSISDSVSNTGFSGIRAARLSAICSGVACVAIAAMFSGCGCDSIHAYFDFKINIQPIEFSCAALLASLLSHVVNQFLTIRVFS